MSLQRYFISEVVMVKFAIDDVIFECPKRDLKKINLETNSCRAKWQDGFFYDAQIMTKIFEGSETITVKFVMDNVIYDCPKRDLKKIHLDTNRCLAKWTDGFFYDAEIIMNCDQNSNSGSDTVNKENENNSGKLSHFQSDSNFENIIGGETSNCEGGLEDKNDPNSNLGSEVVSKETKNNSGKLSTLLSNSSSKNVNVGMLNHETGLENENGQNSNSGNEAINNNQNKNKSELEMQNILATAPTLKNEDSQRDYRVGKRKYTEKYDSDDDDNDKHSNVFSEDESVEFSSDEWTPSPVKKSSFPLLFTRNSAKPSASQLFMNKSTAPRKKKKQKQMTFKKALLLKIGAKSQLESLSSDHSGSCSTNNSRSSSPTIPITKDLKDDAASSKEPYNNETSIPLHEIKVNRRTDAKKKWNKLQYCKYCLDGVQKLPRHFINKHKKEPEVKEFSQLPIKDPKRIEILQNLRNQGNFLHNRVVLKQGHGELHTKRRIALKPPRNNSHEEYTVCNICHVAVLSKYLVNHRKKAHIEILKSNSLSNKVCRSQSRMLLPVPHETTEVFKKDVLSIMKNDEVSCAAQGDELIMIFGERLYHKVDHVGRRTNYYVSQKMREMGRLLLSMREVTKKENLTMKSCLRPQEMSTVVEAVKHLAQFNPEERQYGKPTLAKKCGHSLRKIIFTSIGIAVEREDNAFKKNLEGFLTAMDARWTDEVSSIALRTILHKKFNKPKILPLAEDIQKFVMYLQSEIKIILPKAKTNPDKEILIRLSKQLLCLLICFNRRRTGEAERITVETAGKAIIGDVNSDVMKYLDPYECELATVLSRFETRGKRGKIVPILLTPLMKICVDLLRDPSNRLLMEIMKENQYVFATPKTEDGYYGGCDHLRIFSEECGLLKNPELIRSTKLRKHLAVMTQLVNMTENELDVLARYMGHDIRVHRDFYRLPDHTVDIAKVSKHLLSRSKGIDITNLPMEINEDTEALSENDDSCSEEELVSELESEDKSPPRKNLKKNKNVLKPKNAASEPQKMKKTPWSDEELKTLNTHFHDLIVSNIIPKKKEIEDCQEKFEILKNRPWKNIKDRVRHISNYKNYSCKMN